MKNSTLFVVVSLLTTLACAKQKIGDPIPAAFVSAETAVPGTFLDSRNQTRYKTIKIGTQTWMAENLDFASGKSWCFNDDSEDCETYGRLYDWETAKGVCPTGWRLPSDADWKVLEQAVGGHETAGRFLKAPKGWASEDSSV